MKTKNENLCEKNKNEKILITTVNHHNRCIAIETEIIARERERDLNCEVYAIDVSNISKCIHPDAKMLDKIWFHLNKKYRRIHVSLNKVKDITNEIKHRMNSGEPPKIPKFVNELREYERRGCKLGLAALSTAATFSKCNSNICVDYGHYLTEAWRVAHKALDIAQEIAKENFDKIYIFNGRHAVSRPIVEYLRKVKNTEVLIYESPDNFTGYNIFPSEDIYNAKFWVKEVSKRENTLCEKTGEQYLLKMLLRAPGMPSYTYKSKQKNACIPETLIGKKLITFYTSSPDEFFALSDELYLSKEFKDQYSLSLHVALWCKENNKNFVIRLHPNLANKHKSWKDEWNFKRLEKLGVVLVMPDAEYDSYELMKNSSAIITAGSSIALEAAYLGIPVATVGENFTGVLKIATEVQSRDEMCDFLQNPSPIDDAKKNALKYGAFVHTPMYKFKRAREECNGNFKVGEKNIAIINR